MVFDVKDKVFFVTGAATGIGAIAVRILVEEGAKSVVVFDVNEKAGLAFEKELNTKYGNKVQFIKGDVTNEELFVGSLKKVKEEKGLDVLINNAAIMNDSWEAYKKQIEINVTALVTGSLHALKLMRKDKGGNGGTIVNISSVAGLTQAPLLPVYFATKIAVLQFSNCLGKDDYFAQTGVRVVAMCFGRTDTPLLHNLRNTDRFLGETELEDYPEQKPEAAARGLVDAIKQASSGSTWLATTGRPAKDISTNVEEAFECLSRGVYE